MLTVKINKTLYGNLVSVDNNTSTNKVIATIKLLTGEKISFEVWESHKGRLSEYLGNGIIGIIGVATYNIRKNRYTKFRFEGISEYKSGRVLEGFKQLRKISSGFWDTLNTDKAINNYLKA